MWNTSCKELGALTPWWLSLGRYLAQVFFKFFIFLYFWSLIWMHSEQSSFEWVHLGLQFWSSSLWNTEQAMWKKYYEKALNRFYKNPPMAYIRQLSSSDCIRVNPLSSALDKLFCILISWQPERTNWRGAISSFRHCICSILMPKYKNNKMF